MPRKPLIQTLKIETQDRVWPTGARKPFKVYFFTMKSRKGRTIRRGYTNIPYIRRK